MAVQTTSSNQLYQQYASNYGTAAGTGGSQHITIMPGVPGTIGPANSPQGIQYQHANFKSPTDPSMFGLNDLFEALGMGKDVKMIITCTTFEKGKYLMASVGDLLYCL